MSLVLRQATASDKEAIVSAFLDAFREDILTRQIYPSSEPETYHWWINATEKGLQDPLSTYLVLKDSSSPDPEQVLAFAIWEAPGSPIKAPPGPHAFPTSGNPELAFRFCSAMVEGRRQHMDERRHWHLAFIGTRAGFRGKGAAGQLMRWGIARAEEDGVECFLEASPEGKGMHARYGFEARGEVPVDSPEGDIVATMMVRQPTRRDGEKA